VAGRGGGVALHLVEVAPYGVEPVVRPELVVERVEQPQARLGAVDHRHSRSAPPLRLGAPSVHLHWAGQPSVAARLVAAASGWTSRGPLTRTFFT
jgi:hypothetical protein